MPTTTAKRAVISSLLWSQLVAILLVILIGLAQWKAGHVSMLDALGNWLNFSAGRDSWSPMRQTYDWFVAPHRSSIYQEVFFSRHVKFQYPPSSLLIFAIPKKFGISISDFFLNAVGWVAVMAEVAATAALSIMALSKTADEKIGTAEKLSGAILAGLACLLFYPVLRAYALGQIQTWLNAMSAAAMLAYAWGRRGLAGALIGGICLIKPQLGLVLVWALLRKQWGMAAAMSAVLAIGFGTSLLWFGWQNHVDYLSAIAFMGKHGEAIYANQSINGFVQRLIGNGDALRWHEHDFPPFNAIVYSLTVLTSLLMIAGSLAWRRTGGLGDFAIAILSFTMASPIAWVHHYGVLPPLVVLLATAIARRPTLGSIALLVGAYIMAASFFAPYDEPWLMQVRATPSSYLLFAALIMLYLLYRHGKDIDALGGRQIGAHGDT